MEEVVQKIVNLIKENERIYLFGDADLDGVTAVFIMEMCLKELGKEPEGVFFANRQEFGYGFSEHFYDLFKEKKSGLILVFDIQAGEAERLDGFTVATIDHHTHEGEGIVFNPKDDQFLKPASAAGLSMIVVEALGGLNDDILSLALLGTIADMVPDDGINREIFERGMESIRRTELDSLLGVFDVTEVHQKKLDKRDLIRRVLPILNSAVVQGERSELYSLLGSDRSRAIRMSELLSERRRLHKRFVRAIVDDVWDRMGDEDLLFLGSKEWPIFLAARAASVLADELRKPVFLFNIGEELSQGSVRVPRGVNSLEIMEPCSDLFVNWGGHPAASGFGFKNENREKVEKCLKESFKP